uniref:Periplasmic heavy metal sensor n=1 Tax=Eiseniibacteriota bacterium TaxID=2212470 RepID=A0A832I3M0_UNCEI
MNMTGRWMAAALALCAALALTMAAGARAERAGLADGAAAVAPAPAAAAPAGDAVARDALEDDLDEMEALDAGLLGGRVPPRAGLGPGPGRRPGWGMGARHGRGGMGFGRGGPRGAGPGGLLRALEALELSEAQRKKIEDLRLRHARRAIQARADLATARLDLVQLLRADAPDRRAVEAQIDRIAALRAALEKDRTGMMLDVRAALTPEQLRRLDSLRPGPGRGPGGARGIGGRDGAGPRRDGSVQRREGAAEGQSQ